MKASHYFILLISAIFIISCTSQKQEFTDPLPSWNEGQAKQNVIAFVTDVADEASDNYIDPSDRIATFDNDGTLWSEQPIYFQFEFVFDRIIAMSSDHPEWKEDPFFSAVLAKDIEAVLTSDMGSIMKLVMIASAGMTTIEYEQLVKDWIKTQKHPKTQMLYTDMVYQPMLELMDYLRANDFKTYIVSGGGIEFMRPWTEEIYGIPSEQVIGSTIKLEYQVTESGPVLMRLPELDFFDDKEGKPIAINKFIGKKPVFAAGNSDGDLQMLQWTDSNPLPSFQLYIHHTDAEREWAYDKNSHIGRLDKGLIEANEKGWTVVSMKDDWKTIY